MLGELGQSIVQDLQSGKSNEPGGDKRGPRLPHEPGKQYCNETRNRDEQEQAHTAIELFLGGGVIEKLRAA